MANQGLIRGFGWTFVELLAVVLLLGILVLVALPNYFGAESDAKSKVDQANVRAINASLALFKIKNNAKCPGDLGVATFAAFLADTAYFSGWQPEDPYRNPPDSVPYQHTYSLSLCRVLMTSGTVNHQTGGGH